MPKSEYLKRLSDVEKFFQKERKSLIVGEYNHAEWLQYVNEFKDEPEGGKRCALCFKMRMEKTAKLASEMGFHSFTTTLTIGPNKPARVIFPIGRQLAKDYNIKFLEFDFKKKDGFKISCQLSKQFNMYRQNYCGCEFSFRDKTIRSR